MKSRLISRVERLESRMQSVELRPIDYGWVTHLPEDFTGERHVAKVRREPTRSPRFFWCQFEEREGPLPPGSDE